MAYVVCDVRNGEMRIRKRDLRLGPYEIGLLLAEVGLIQTEEEPIE